MLRLQFVTIFLVLLPLLAAASIALYTEKPADVKKEPETVAGQILKLGCDQAQREWDEQELSMKEMPVEEREGLDMTASGQQRKDHEGRLKIWVLNNEYKIDNAKRFKV